MSTQKYKNKRNLYRSGEPGWTTQRAGSKKPTFVIQEHDASSLHHDFRLEAGDALKSWAVPKGLSTDPRDKRLAIRTEDHPLDYADFEGVIPEGGYGAGTVLVWDRGHFKNVTEKGGKRVSLEDALDQGHIVVWLSGEKLAGGYVLQRIESGDEEQWLIIKVDDDDADARRNPVSTEPQSVKSGKTRKQLARAEREQS